METRDLGKSGIEISPIIMGTWQAGKEMWVDISDRASEKAIRAAYDAGITAFDTAEVYGKGHSEIILGRSLKAVRDRVVIMTKVFANHLKRDQVIAACHRSLKHLDTDYIDLYQIHWPAGSFGTPRVPVEETMQALNDLLEQKKIRAIGVSNFSAAQIEEASQYGRIDSLQPPYSLFWRHVETDAMPLCARRGITLLAYSAMAQGFLTGKFGPSHQFHKKDIRSRNILGKGEHYQRVQAALEKLRPIARANDITLGQLALSWVTSRPSACAIAGARSADQVALNAAAGNVKLSGEDLAKMDEIGKTVTDHLNDNPVMWQ